MAILSTSPPNERTIRGSHGSPAGSKMTGFPQERSGEMGAQRRFFTDGYTSLDGVSRDSTHWMRCWTPYAAARSDSDRGQAHSATMVRD